MGSESAAIFGSDVSTTLVVSMATLLAVCVPFYRGFRVGLRALSATRKVQPDEIEQALRGAAVSGGEAITISLLRVLRKSLRENQQGLPSEFVVDASRQYVMHDYEAQYSRPISMVANILPPIGFIGTTGGLFILFLSMRVASDSLELGALALALTSSIFALVAFALLEGLKIRLYARMLRCIDDAEAFYRGARSRESDAGATAEPARA
jgi:hypothetical protein